MKYAYLNEKKIYTVIISANLSEHEEERLLKFLRKHRAAIGYTLGDLKCHGIYTADVIVQGLSRGAITTRLALRS